MNNDDIESRIARLVTETVNAALNSGLEPAQAIACFGLASKILMQQGTADHVNVDPHAAFAKGLAQMAETKAGAYH